jgi:hypothetical protein
VPTLGFGLGADVAPGEDVRDCTDDFTVDFAPACAWAASALNPPTSATAAAANIRVPEATRRRPASR